MKVLYIDCDGPLGGASRSLFEVVRQLSKGAVDPYFVAVEGTALEFYRQIAKDSVTTPGLINARKLLAVYTRVLENSRSDQAVHAIEHEFEYIATKLDLTVPELQALMAGPNKSYRDYKSMMPLIDLGTRVLRTLGVQKMVVR